MSTEERNIILQMLSEGKISSEEAADLLDALDVKDEEEARKGTSAWNAQPPPLGRRVDPDLPGMTKRGLLIEVADGKESAVHVHLPLGMALAAKKFMPKRALEYLEEYGIDLSQILEGVTSEAGPPREIVNVRDGETRVQIVLT